MTKRQEKEFDKLVKGVLSRRRYITPKSLMRIENDAGWSNLVGPKFMEKLCEMYEIPKHSHTNGLMSCATCAFLVLQYEDDLKELEKGK